MKKETKCTSDEEIIYLRLSKRLKSSDRNKMYDFINTSLKSKNSKFRGLRDIDIEIAMGNKEEVSRLLDNGTDVNKVNDLGVTPLIIAIYFDNLEMAELLIKRGANVNIAGPNLYSPLIYACNAGDYSVIKLLSDNNADIFALDGNGYNALHHLSDCPSAPNRFSIEELEWAFPNQIKTIPSSDSQIKALDLLVEKGIDIDYCVEGTDINAVSIALAGYGPYYDKLLKRLIDLKAKRIATPLIDFSDENFDSINEYIYLLTYYLRIIRFGIKLSEKKNVKIKSNNI